jgi:transposase
MAYSIEYRREVVNFCKENSVRKAAKTFRLSTDTITNWKTLLKETGSLEKRKMKDEERKVKMEDLEELLRNKPDLLQREMAEHFQVSRFAKQDALMRLVFKRKKKTTLYRERDEGKRKEYFEKIAEISKDSMVYVDESGINEYLCREYCYARRGTKIIGEISGKKFKRINIIAGYVDGKTIAECVYECNSDKEFIESWVENFLIKELKKDKRSFGITRVFIGARKLKK